MHLYQKRSIQQDGSLQAPMRLICRKVQQMLKNVLWKPAQHAQTTCSTTGISRPHTIYLALPRQWSISVVVALTNSLAVLLRILSSDIDTTIGAVRTVTMAMRVTMVTGVHVWS